MVSCLKETNFKEDTIAAIATPAGVGAISVIRISGPEAIGEANKIFVGKKNLSECPSHTIHYGKIIDKNGNFIDDVLVSVFLSPKSYTGEDIAEISFHGNPFIAGRILEALFENKVRPAEPGEFTRRAFINGKLDLAQAEAVAEIIEARTEASLKGARNQLDGLLSRKVHSLREKLVNTSSLLELELDFSEEDIELIENEKVISLLSETIEEINELLSTYGFGRIIKDGINVAIVGIPNVGKSSLLNYLLKEYRAIVSDIPGTTRDIIREEVTIDGILFKLFDTAGIRDSSDEIEKEGVLRSKEAVKSADLILFLSDVEQNISKPLLEELLSLTSKEKIIFVMNKIDKNPAARFEADVCISAKTGEGIKVLFTILKDKALGTNVYSEKTAVISSWRHYNLLKEAKSSLEKALDSAVEKLSEEFISVDLRNAESALGEIIGEISTDDILNNIFQKFCIGK